MEARKTGLDTALTFGPWLLFAAFLAAVIVTPDLPQSVRDSIFAGVALVMIVLGVVNKACRQRRLDEMEVAASRFGALWSPIAVTVFFVAAAFLSLFQPALVGLGGWFGNPGQGGPPPAVAMFVLGGVTALLVQMAAQSALRAAWMWSKR